MMIKRTRIKSESEPTIALINIVFLMLIFFMVTGTLAQTLDKDLELVRTQDLEGRAPPDALVIHEDGRMSFRGETLESVEAYFAARGEESEESRHVRLVPDRALPAQDLVNLAGKLRAKGAEQVMLVTERGLP